MYFKHNKSHFLSQLNQPQQSQTHSKILHIFIATNNMSYDKRLELCAYDYYLPSIDGAFKSSKQP